jgi:hypothetical protein
LRKGQVWPQEGAVCDKLAFIEKGVVKIYFGKNDPIII